MGQEEILNYLIGLRYRGDHRYRPYYQIHKGLSRNGVALSRVSVWRSVNSLFWSGDLEMNAAGDVLQRKVGFRAKVEKKNGKDYFLHSHKNILQTGPIIIQHRK